VRLTDLLRRRSISLAGLLVGLAVGGLAWLLGRDWLQAAMFGWCGLVLSHGALVMRRLWPAGADAMRGHAETLNQGRWLVLLLSLSAAGASLGAVALDLGGEPKGSAPLALATVLLSWFYVHLLFAQDYAREFWLKGGGIRFHGGDENPPFSEFIYLAYGIGTTCGVTDVDTHSASIRRVATLHSLIAFGFNAVIVAGTVGIVSGLVGGK
jgi:uncharacterized membrane protein